MKILVKGKPDSRVVTLFLWLKVKLLCTSSLGSSSLRAHTMCTDVTGVNGVRAWVLTARAIKPQVPILNRPTERTILGNAGRGDAFSVSTLGRSKEAQWSPPLPKFIGRIMAWCLSSSRGERLLLLKSLGQVLVLAVVSLQHGPTN